MSSSRPRAIATTSQAPPAVRAVLPARKPRKINKSAPPVVSSGKGKEKASNQEDVPRAASVEVGPPKKKRKRAPPARIPSPALSSTSTATPPPAPFVRPPPAEETLDLFDVSSIPHNGQIARTQGALDRLEMGNYRSALHDVAKLELDLSKNLVEWEAARLLQSRREEEGLVEERERTLRIAREKRDREEQRRVEKEVRMAQGIVEDVEMDESDDEPKTKSKNEEESDDEVPPCAPLTAYDLARVSRWPLVPSVLLEDEFTLGEELLALLESKSEVINSRNANNGAVEPPRKRSTRAPSAYAPDGPLATTEDLSSQSDSDDSINSDDSFSLTPNVSRIVVTLASTLDSLLQSMAQETTPCYFPPTDYWEAKMVKDAWRTKPPRKGLDFNDVMRIVEDMAVVPQAVKDLLSEQLHDLYGSDAHPDLPGSPVESPPATNDWPTTSTTRLSMEGAERLPEHPRIEMMVKTWQKKKQ